LSGDAPEIVFHVARALGIDSARAALTPEGKIEALREVMARPGSVVAMVGDGVNDAPVLAGAHVSVAMGEGADLARLNADVVLLGSDLSGVARAVRHARRTLVVVAQNHRWAFTYNLLAIPFAMAGWVTPWMAGLGMAASSLGVVLNALRLQRAP
jgi:Cu2+-exporting ATPase